MFALFINVKNVFINLNAYLCLLNKNKTSTYLRTTLKKSLVLSKF